MRTSEVPKPSGRRCKTCLTTNPDDFYPTQKAAYCRTHFLERYFAPGRARLLASKLERGQCKDCGLIVTAENSFLFDYDHLHSKTRNVSLMNTAPDSLFQAEIAKCDLVCANDHRIRTFKRGWKGGRPRGIRPTPLGQALPPESELPASNPTPTDTRP